MVIGLRLENYGIRITNYELRITNYEIRIRKELIPEEMNWRQIS
jgi:hypothetical protein